MWPSDGLKAPLPEKKKTQIMVVLALRYTVSILINHLGVSYNTPDARGEAGTYKSSLLMAI